MTRAFFLCPSDPKSEKKNPINQLHVIKKFWPQLQENTMPMSLKQLRVAINEKQLVSFFCMIMPLCTSPELHKQLFMSASSSIHHTVHVSQGFSP